MANIRLIHWNGPEGRERKLRLASLGHHVEFDDVDGPALLRVLRRSTPDAFVIDLSRLPSGGRTIGMWLRTNKSTRHIPIVFVDGDPEKVKRIRALLPDAVYSSFARLGTTLPKAIARPARQPIVPPSSIYTGRSAADKLGIKPGMRVAAINAPSGFMPALNLPPDVTLTASPDPNCDLFLSFARDRRDVSSHLVRLKRDVTRQTLWLAWPKKASRVRTDLDGNFIRQAGVAAGWVDFKVCALDDTWSALAFKRRQ